MFDVAMRSNSAENHVTVVKKLDLNCLEFEFPAFCDGKPVYEQIDDALRRIPNSRTYNRIYNRLNFFGYISMREIEAFRLKELHDPWNGTWVIVCNDPLTKDRFDSGIYEQLFPNPKIYLTDTMEKARRIMHYHLSSSQQIA